MADNSLLKALDSIPLEFLYAMLDTLPVQFSLIDADDNVVFWNLHGTRIFKRGPAVIGRNVRMCHPSDSIGQVEKVIAVLKSGKKDSVAFWMDLPDGDTPRKLLIKYYSIRDDDGKYLGIVETTINLTPLQGITGEKRLGDFKSD